MYSQAERLAKQIMDLPDDQGGFGQGLAAPFKDGTVQSLGITDVVDAAMQMQAGKKVGTMGSSDADKAVINLLGLSQTGQQDLGSWYRRGEMVSQALPFMAQFALTSGIGAAGAKTVQKAAVRLMKKELKTKAAEVTASATRFGARTVGQAVARSPFLSAGQVRALEGMRGSPKLDAETGMFTIDKETQEGVVEAIAKGLGTNVIEAGFEQMGEGVAKGVGMLAKKFGVKIPKTGAWLRETKSKVGFNGFLGELIEELPTEFVQQKFIEGASFTEAYEAAKEGF